MNDVYEVLRQKEVEVSRLQKEVQALRVAAPLLTDVKGEDYNQPTLQRAANDTHNPTTAGGKTKPKSTDCAQIKGAP